MLANSGYWATKSSRLGDANMGNTALRPSDVMRDGQRDEARRIVLTFGTVS
jgi:hypothetical protein